MVSWLRTLSLLVLLSAALQCVSQDSFSTTSGSPSISSPPLYQVSFQRGDAVAGVSSTQAVEVPFKCTSDGTIFATFVGSVPANSGLLPPLMPPLQFVSITPPERGQIFRLDRVPELFVSREIDYYPAQSEVVFLVSASRENKPEKQTVSWGREGAKREYTANGAEQHPYILTFSRDGEYKRTAEIDDSFSILHVGLFPSGTFLALGLDKADQSPKLAMLKEDGTLLKFLELAKGDTPASMIDRRNRVIVQSQFVSEGRSILIVQNNTTYPILEVAEGGTIRAIRPKLPLGLQIEAAIPSDQSLYVIVSPQAKGDSAGAIYEMNPDDGSLLRRFELTHGRRASNVACVHEGKFLSLDYAGSNVVPVPLIGSIEPSNGSQKP
jgi:hypothetical protein